MLDMPTRLKCEQCEEKFYTAKNEKQIKDKEECQHCGGNLIYVSQSENKKSN